MKKYLISMFLLLSFLPIVNLFPCTCGEVPYFIEAHKKADLVCILTVESYLFFAQDKMPLSMGVSISELLHGTEVKSKIAIWGDRGWDCAPSLTNFPIGTTWLVALNKITDTTYYNSPGVNVGDYTFMECAECYMEVKDSAVNGYFFEGTQTNSDYPLEEIIGIIQGTTDVFNEKIKFINNFELFQNYPNPFNPQTKIRYYLPEDSYVKMEVVNFLGQNISILESGYKSIGKYDYNFNGSELPSGMYFCRLFVNHELRKTIKMVLLK